MRKTNKRLNGWMCGVCVDDNHDDHDDGADNNDHEDDDDPRAHPEFPSLSKINHQPK